MDERSIREPGQMVPTPPDGPVARVARLEAELAELREYVFHLRDHLEGVTRHTPYPARSWTLEEFREHRNAGKLSPL